MHLQFLGVSSALSVGYKHFNTNMLIQADSMQRLLIDCGSDIRHSLFEQGYTISDVNAVYLSHLHADHVGGLEWLGFSKYFIEKKLINLYISKDQCAKLWNNVLSGGMSTLENQEATLETFFRVQSLENLYFKWEELAFKLIKVPHSYCNQQLLPSYGLFIEDKKQKVFITTDTRFAPGQLNAVYSEADLIFQDCETSVYRSQQHANYSDLCTLDLTIKKKMWLYGYNEGSLPDAVKDGFKGFVKIGQSFEFE